MPSASQRVVILPRWAQAALLIAGAALLGTFVAVPLPFRAMAILGMVGVAFLALAVHQHSAAMDAVLFLNLATITLAIYAFPIAGGFDLQLNRIPILVAIPLWLLPSLCPPYRTLRLRSSPVFLWYGLFTAYVLLSTVLLSDNSRTAISQLVAIIFRGALLIWLVQVVVLRKHLLLAARALVVSGLVIIAFALYQYIAWTTRVGMVGYSFTIPFSDLFGMTQATLAPTGRIGPIFRLTLPFSSSSHLAPMIAALLLVAIGQWLYSSKKTRTSSLLLLIYGLVMALLLLGTFSRGAWVGFAAGLLLIVIVERRLFLKQRVWRAMLVGVVLIAVLLPLLLPHAGAVLGRFDPVLTGPSNEGHFKFLNLAVELFLSSPIVGIGWGNYEVRTGALHAHNMYMTVLAEGGVIGLALWLLFCLTIVRHGIRAVQASEPGTFLRYWNLGLSAAFLSLLVDNLFQNSAYYGLAWLIPGLIIASHYVTTSKMQEGP